MFIYKDVLKNNGLKNTKHRNAILDLLEKSNEPINAEEIFFQINNSTEKISLSTIYRELTMLINKGLVVKTSITGDNKAVFEFNRMEHKHHLVCTQCKTIFTVEGCPFAAYEEQLKEKMGFDISGHKLEIYGVCKACHKI